MCPPSSRARAARAGSREHAGARRRRQADARGDGAHRRHRLGVAAARSWTRPLPSSRLPARAWERHARARWPRAVIACRCWRAAPKSKRWRANWAAARPAAAWIPPTTWNASSTRRSPRMAHRRGGQQHGNPPKGPLLELTDADWRTGLDMVLLNVVRMARLVTPGNARTGRRRVREHLDPSRRSSPTPAFPVSSAMRAALAGFCKMYADQEAKHNIRMNNVLPGFIDTRPVNESHSRGHSRRTVRACRGDCRAPWHFSCRRMRRILRDRACAWTAGSHRSL